MGPFRILLPLVTGLLAAAPPAQEEEPEVPRAALADRAAFEGWFRDWKAGAFRLVREGRPDPEALAEVDRILADLAEWNDLPSAKRLFAVASVELSAPGGETATDRIQFHRELQPWKVKALARKHLAGMDGEGIVPWLLEKLRSLDLREEDHPDRAAADTVLRILGSSESAQAQLELLRASGRMPAELRVRAVNALGRSAGLDAVEPLIRLLRDSEPNVRIAACNALGRALGPHTDETRHDEIPEEVARHRDDAIDRLERLARRDRVWQVRSAAAFALANLRCKAVVPVLIEALEAELGRKRDPWAMDLRLHRLLEGLTGQTMLEGQVETWEEFWEREGAGFAFAPADADPDELAADARYQKFFNLSIESDRVLFVLDFSGSMVEPVTLTTPGTAAGKTGEPVIKAELVVRELEKIVMSLPDGTLFNIIVFSDDVTVWREDRHGRPALVRLDDDARDDLLGSFLGKLHPRGPTNLYGALDRALEFGGRGLYDKYYEAGFDTMYILSDGAPSWGEVIDRAEIRRRVREANSLKKLTINTVTFGKLNQVDFLRKLAEENNGRHIHVE